MAINRRNTLIGLGALAVGGGVISATGAFTQVEADRTVQVDVAGDADALLGLQVSGLGDDSGVVDEVDGLLTIDFGATGADGLNLGARTTVGELDDDDDPSAVADGDEAFTIVNNGDQTIDVSFDIDFHTDQDGESVSDNDPADHLKLWTDVSGSSGAMDGDEFGNLVADDLIGLESGDDALVVIQVDTTDLDESDVNEGSPLFEEEATITANAQ